MKICTSTKIEYEKYEALVNEIQNQSTDLLKGVNNKKMRDAGTVTIQEYTKAQKQIMTLIKKYQKHMDNVIEVLEKSKLRLKLLDEEAAKAAGKVEKLD